MADARLERLMNLVAYLSNTKRPLTLREIIETVPGYPESLSSARRAFERDKDDLRAMGFDINLEDTPNGDSGYRIRKENTYFDVKLSPAQRSIVEFALALYGPEKRIAKSALTKLGGMNPENEVSEVMSLAMPALVDDIYIAIVNKQSIKIGFRGNARTISPHRVIAKSGYWYVKAYDHEKLDSRTFRIDRIDNIEKQDAPFIGEEDTEAFDEEAQEIVRFVVKVNPALIKQFGRTWSGRVDLENSTVSFTVPRREIFLSRLFEYSGFVAVVEPKDIAKDLIERFDLARLHIGDAQ